MFATLVLMAAIAGAVIDGDTVRISGDVIRLHGVDAPEILHPSCAAEKTAGENAKAFLAGIFATARKIEIKGVANSPDRYGRVIARLTIDGYDVGEVMVAAGHARRWDYDGGAAQPNWCE